MSDGDEFNHERQRQFDYLPEARTSRATAALMGHQPDEGTSTTLPNQSAVDEITNFRPCVADIDRLVELYQAGERSKFEIISAITRLLGEDKDVSAKQRSQSFDLHMAEIDSIQASPQNKGKGKSKFGRPAANERLSVVTVGEPEGESNEGRSSSSSEEPRKRRKLHHRTQQSYGSALNSWIAFTEMHQFPIEPTSDTLSFYIVYMSHYISPRSVQSYLAGLVQQLEPDFPQIREIRASPLITKVMKGCINMRAKEVRRKRLLSMHDLVSGL